MRKNALYFLPIPFAILFVIFYFFLDSWVESTLEESIESVTGAKVEIDDLHIKYFPVGVEWSRIQVANPYDPWTNLFETSNVKCELDANQLLRKKIIIETVEVYGLGIGSKRTTSGELQESRRKKSTLISAESAFRKSADNAFKEVLKTTPIFDLVKLKNGFNPDSLIKILDIKSVAKMDSVKQQVLHASKQWDNSINDFEASKTKVLEIEAKIKAIDPSQLKNPQNIISAISVVDNSIKTINEVKSSFESRFNSINSDLKTLSVSVDSVDDFVKKDFQHLKDMARLPSINTPSIAQLLVGNEMYKRAMSYLGYADMARANVKKYQPEPEYEKPSRFEGQNISFPALKSYPKFWIKQIIVKGGKSGDVFAGKGQIKNISNDQNVVGLPITADISGNLSNKRSIELKGLIDRRNDVPFDQYSAKLSGVPTGDFNLGKSDFLPAKIKNSILSSTVSISLPGKSFDSNVDFKLSSISLEFVKEPKNIFESIVRQVLERVKDININLRMWNTKGSMDIALATDLDDQIAKRLKEVVGGELVKLQNQLKAKFDSFIAGKRNEFEKIYNSKISEIRDKINAYQSLIDDKLNLVEAKKKELTDRLEKEKSGLIENKLKDLFKK